MSNAVSQTKVIQGWIDRLRAGEESARGELLNCACERLTRLAHKMLKTYSRLKRWEQTDDVVQNAAVRLYRTLGEVQPETAADFFRLAALNIRRELLDMTKHYFGPQGQGAKHATVGPPGDDSSDANAICEPADNTAEPGRLSLWTDFHTQIDKLPEEEKQIFDLLWYQGLSQAEAAEMLHVSERTVKRRWQSARLKLHEALGGRMPDA